MSQLYDWLKTAAKAQGNTKALVYRDNYLSWRGLLHRVDRRAQEFKSMGVREGAWCGLMLGNVPDFVILALALAKLDAAIVPIDPTTGSRELELILAAAPLRALVTRPRGSEGSIAANGTTGARRTGRVSDSYNAVTGEEVPEIRRRLQGTLLTCSVFKRPNPDFDVEPLSVMFTADSLGDPKGVLRTAENLAAISQNVVDSLKIEKTSKILTAVPLYHAYGWDLGLLPTLQTGATMFLEEEISARRVAKLLRDHTIDVMPGTPTMYAELCRLPTAKPLRVKNPRFVSGGSKLDPAVAESFREKYEVNRVSCYHSTEAGVVSMDLLTKHPHSVGKTVGSVEVKLTTNTGAKLTIGKEGILWARGESLSKQAIGPYKDVDTTVSKGKKKKLVEIGETDGDGWFRTGDQAKTDRASRLFLLGREDDVVKVGGKRVALGEVEGCLESFPNVKAAQALVVTDPHSGSVVVARVVTARKCQPEELIDHCARNLAPYKVPRRIEFCDQI
jgi:long-chain acyl-CoA synthetase